jgi:hypothetical protein
VKLGICADSGDTTNPNKGNEIGKSDDIMIAGDEWVLRRDESVIPRGINVD